MVGPERRTPTSEALRHTGTSRSAQLLEPFLNVRHVGRIWCDRGCCGGGEEGSSWPEGLGAAARAFGSIDQSGQLRTGAHTETMLGTHAGEAKFCRRKNCDRIRTLSIGSYSGPGFAWENRDRLAMPQTLSGRQWLEKLCGLGPDIFRSRNNFFTPLWTAGGLPSLERSHPARACCFLSTPEAPGRTRSQLTCGIMSKGAVRFPSRYSYTPTRPFFVARFPPWPACPHRSPIPAPG